MVKKSQTVPQFVRLEIRVVGRDTEIQAREAVKVRPYIYVSLVIIFKASPGGTATVVLKYY